MTGMYPWLPDALASGAEVVTANKRLGRALRQVFDEQQLSRGLSTWHTPQILPWTAWLATLRERCHAMVDLPLRIHPFAAQLVWERLLRDYTHDRILNPHGLARQAQQTWQRLNDWCVPIEDLRVHAVSDDERLFADLAIAYRNELEANAWMDPASAASFMTTIVEAGAVEVPARIVHAGFDRIVPAAARLFDALEKRGTEVSEAPRRGRGVAARVVSCTDKVAELRAAGRWARKVLESDPAAAVAIVCPGLERDAPGDARLVREGLVPGWQYAGEAHEKAVNVSYGQRLSAYPLVAAALLWLSWTSGGLRTRDVSVLLRTPFAGLARIDGRCRLENALTRFPDRNWRAASLVAALDGAERSQESLDWLRRVELVAAIESERRILQSPALWAARIDRFLQELGWPGEKPLDSDEFQLANRWRDLLNEFSRIDVVHARIDLGEAVARVSSLAADTIYQPEAPPAAVQLLGTLEAAGLEFDHLWVCHLDAEQWPPPSRPLPLISRALQRKLGMPDATPGDTLDFARRILARLADSAADVTFSWPMTEEDLELEASPLLPSYARSSEGEDPGWHARSLAAGNAVKLVADTVPPIRPGETVSGGASAVRRQVSDPFSAFACGRLGIRELRRVESGLPASARGNIIHRALQHLYRDKPASREIAKWGADTDARIEEAIDRGVRRHARGADPVLLRLLSLERRRLRAMLRAFLSAELRRQEFEVVAVEESRQLVRHGVVLELKIDRIDRLADGSLLIADYKTGALKTLLSRDGEPKELQLVVYAAAVDEPVGGLVLVNVDSRDIVYRGAGGSVEWDRSPPELWEGRLHDWKRRVDDALTRIAAGDVRLNTSLETGDSRPLNVLSRVEELKRGR